MEEKNKDKVLGSAVVLRALTIANAGDYKVEVSAGSETKSVTWNVYGTAALTENDEFVLRLQSLDHLFIG